MKKVFKVLAVVFVICLMFSNVFADLVTDPGYSIGSADPNNKIQNTAKSVWSTVITLVQILSVACVVFTGIRYMFASADQRADIKKGLIYLAIGSTFVFSAVTIINFVINAAGEVTK